jgi:hypothetical protein
MLAVPFVLFVIKKAHSRFLHKRIYYYLQNYDALACVKDRCNI